MNLTPEMILRGYQANTAALEEMIFVKGKVAIVTGGTSGLGFCVARRLCQGGAKVVLASSTREKGDLAVRLLKEEGFDVNYFMANGYGIPNYYEEVFLANNEMIESEPEVLKGFLRASAKGFEDFKKDPDGCLAILMNNQNEENFPLTQSVEEKSCETLLPLMETEDVPFLTQTEECWQENIDWMLESGLIDQKVEVSDVMVDLGE